MATSQQIAFGADLRRERERRRITLARVAESTKISQSLLAALERGDASRWPSGIYRRAFVREFASSIGLPPEQTVADFCRLFPESGAPPRELPAGDTDLRLTLAPESGIDVHQLTDHGIAVVIDLLLVAALGSLLSVVLTDSKLAVFGTAAAIYYMVGTICLGRSPGLWLLHSSQSRRDRLPEQLLDLVPANSSARALIEDARSAGV